MKSREDRAHTHDLFGESEDQPDDSAGNLVDLETVCYCVSLFVLSNLQGFNEAQAQELAQNTLQIQQREQDILNIVKVRLSPICDTGLTASVHRAAKHHLPRARHLDCRPGQALGSSGAV
jgi:hypothetical protein